MRLLDLTFRRTLGPVRLHGHVRIQMIERAIGFLAAIPPALVHSLDFFVSPSRTFVLLSTRNWDERVNCRKRMTTLYTNVNVRQQTSETKRNETKCNVPAAVAASYVQPCPARRDQTMQVNDHTLAARNDQPILVCRTPFAVRHTAASHVVVGRENSGLEEGRSGSPELSMDLLVHLRQT